MGTIVISSAHGLRASAIGRALSDVLDVPVLDRAIPARVARDLAVPIAEALAHDEHLAGGLGGLFVRYAVPLVAAGGLGTPWPTIGEDEFRDKTEQVIQEVAAGPGAVVIGRAGAFVLGERPDVLSVRLTGPEQERIARLMDADGLTEVEARRRVRETDHAREVYVRHFYRRRWDDPTVFHLTLNATAFPESTCVAIIAAAARGRFRASAWR